MGHAHDSGFAGRLGSLCSGFLVVSTATITGAGDCSGVPLLRSGGRLVVWRGGPRTPLRLRGCRGGITLCFLIPVLFNRILSICGERTSLVVRSHKLQD